VNILPSNLNFYLAAYAGDNARNDAISQAMRLLATLPLSLSLSLSLSLLLPGVILCETSQMYRDARDALPRTREIRINSADAPHHCSSRASFPNAPCQRPARNKKLLFAARPVSDEALLFSITGRSSHFIRQ